MITIKHFNEKRKEKEKDNYPAPRGFNFFPTRFAPFGRIRIKKATPPHIAVHLQALTNPRFNQRLTKELQFSLHTLNLNEYFLLLE